ncbi:MAG: Ig-like domain-containing protein [Ruminococcus sp.]|uniref:Ig-like domain-containing protein n=1 Tax=Ruminococcus sp. TaxID=41978 RepID=UPI0025DAEE17|nr:Ig-like domain-containing protein [Ruminococcus sp.]MBO4867429.1 Ig-like domain-containing protein [Ruminococcus sp.]
MKNTKRFITGMVTLAMVSAMAPINAFATENIKTLDASTSSNSTDVKYSVDPSYTVVIPASITLSDTAATSASISVDETAKPFKLAKGQKLSVKIANEDTNDFKVTNADNSLDYTVTAGSDTLAKGSTAAEFSNDDKTDKTLTFSKMDSTLAKYAGDYTGTLTFGIELEDASTPVTAITLNKTATTIQAGQTETLSVSSVTPDDATDKTVTWSSDNEAVATVNSTTGEVTAVAFGTANITATANDGSGVTATCAVTVNKVVTINLSDWGGYDTSITKDGVTVSADLIDPEDGNLMGGGTFSTTLGNFTKIVVTTGYCNASGTGWSGGTWTGTPASTVSFNDGFRGITTIVCTIEPTN